MYKATPIILLFVLSCGQINESGGILATPLIPYDSINLFDLEIYSVDGLVKLGSEHYLVDRPSKKVVRLDDKFRTLSVYDITGNGPNEFSDPFDITGYGDRIYVIDLGDRKIQSFTLDLLPLAEISAIEPPVSLFALNESILLMGTLNMEFEDVYRVNFSSSSFDLDGRSAKVKVPLSGIVFHTSNSFGDVLRYRQFTNRFEILLADNTMRSYANTSQPDFPEVYPQTNMPPLFKTKIHNTAFLTSSRACFLSGDSSEGLQPMQCFSFLGHLLSKHELHQPSPISLYSDSTLYTYSPKTNHIYVYNLGF